MKGLVNLGNTCYLNTAVQCLLSLPAFRKHVLALAATDEEADRPAVTVTAALGKVARILYEMRRPARPRALVAALQAAVGTNMQLQEQNDIHELLTFLVDRLVCEQPPAPPPPPPAAAACRKPALQQAMDAAWRLEHKGRPLADKLYGQRVAQVRCLTCGAKRHTPESFLTLDLDLEEEGAGADDGGCGLCVQRLLRRAFRREAIRDYACERCGKDVPEAERLTRVYRAPPLLTVCLKRFTPLMQKVLTPTGPPPPSIDLGPCCVNDAPHVYDLHAVACHAGSAHAGHYFAMVRDTAAQRWLKVDDDSVEPCDLARVPTSWHYVLFYARR